MSQIIECRAADDMFSQSNLEFLKQTWKGFIALVLNVLKTDVIVKTGVWCLSKEKKDFSKNVKYQ